MRFANPGCRLLADCLAVWDHAVSDITSAISSPIRHRVTGAVHRMRLVRCQGVWTCAVWLAMR